MRFATPLAGLALVGLALASPGFAGDEHWSRQFKKPKASGAMGPGFGPSDGTGKPSVMKLKWHEGRLWMAGAWESGVSAETGKAERNEYWYMWTWSPSEGIKPFSWFHSAQGGHGPDGKIHDFVFLPDGRLVVGGSFTRCDNLGGNRYHKVNALAVWDPREPTAEKWKPLGTFQYNGTVSEGGSIFALAYDAQGNDLYVGGSFPGIRGGNSPAIHRYDLDTASYEPMGPSVFGGNPNAVRAIVVDPRTNPSTILVGGEFKYVGGDGKNPEAGGTAAYSTGFATWQQGKGWTAYPPDHPRDGTKGKDAGILQRAGDYMWFDSAVVRDILLDGDDIWIAGSFSQGSEQKTPLRGLAKWDPATKMWTDPTGKGGFGRDLFGIGKAANGKIYVTGAFGGLKAGNQAFPGFVDGTAANLVACYDPATKTWDGLGSGLGSRVLPECRMAIAGNDVYFAGDFSYLGTGADKLPPKEKEARETWLVARWNETVDFTQGNGPDPEAPRAYVFPPEVPRVTGNEHWSRAFPKADRKTPMSGKTGMENSAGSPDVAALEWIGDTLYFGGSWEAKPGQRWFVWSYHAEKGWTPLATSKGEGPEGPPEGIRAKDGKLYVFGALSKFSGICTYDPATGKWEQFGGTYKGKPVQGNAVGNRAGPINDVAWDSKTGDFYMVGSSGLERPETKFPKSVGQVIRVDKTGEYHPMGYMLMPEDPNKPNLGIYAIAIDETKEPSEIVIGGTFMYYGEPPTHASRMLFNVARWDRAADDWKPIGKGFKKFYSEHYKQYYPDGLPGLPSHPMEEFSGFMTEVFPRVRDLKYDKDGNLWACGSLAIVDDSLPIKDRKETFGIAKYDPKLDQWVPPTRIGGLIRDPLQMTMIDDSTMIVSGAFNYGADFSLLHGVAKVDTRTGEVSPLGGGLPRASKEQIYAPMVVHAVKGDEIWFAGNFDHAGINADSNVEAPNPSAYVAVWNPKANLDPNGALKVKPVEAVCRPKGFSAVPVAVSLEAEGADPAGKVNWYEKSTSGEWKPKGAGAKLDLKLQVKADSPEPVVYVSVTNAAGVEGGRLPVKVPLKACP